MIDDIVKQVESFREGLQGWCTAEKARDLVEVIVDRRPEVVVESGIFGGRSLLAMGAALRKLGHGVAWGCDPWSVDAALEGEKDPANRSWWEQNVDLELVYRGFVEAVLRHELTKECRWLRMKGNQASRAFQYNSIDLFHLDSNHSELVSCQEVFDWGPRMAPHSIWIMDDSDWPSQRAALNMIRDLGFQVRLDRKSYIIFQR